MKKFFYILIASLSSAYIHIVNAASTRTVPDKASLESGMMPVGDITGPSIVKIDGDGTSVINSFFSGVKDNIFDLLGMISIGVFLFIGFRLVVARGNPDEFKKALINFVYAVIGLAVISLSYAIVSLVAGLNF